MYGKRKFAKIKGSIFNIPIEKANICNILTRRANSNGLIAVKLKRDLSTVVMFIFCQYILMSCTTKLSKNTQ